VFPALREPTSMVGAWSCRFGVSGGDDLQWAHGGQGYGVLMIGIETTIRSDNLFPLVG